MSEGRPIYKVVPITGRAARAWIERTHRHLPKLQGALFAVAVSLDGEVVGVATAGNPPRVWQGTGRFVITRCAALSDLPGVGFNPDTGQPWPAPVCTMLYAALCRAGRALGYREAWTYTLSEEHGTSLRASGFEQAGETGGGEHDRPSRPRAPAINADPKGRWFRILRHDQSEQGAA